MVKLLPGVVIKENVLAALSIMHLTAYSYPASSVTVNITSELVNLYGHAEIGYQSIISNITITSDINATVKCHNNGSLLISNTFNVTIRGITWDQCGNPNHDQPSHLVSGGVTFASPCNVTIDSCTSIFPNMCSIFGVCLW